MKKLSLIMVIVLAMLSFVACSQTGGGMGSEQDVVPNSLTEIIRITIPKSIDVKKGDAGISLSAEVVLYRYDSNDSLVDQKVLTDRKVKWESEDSSIATVDENGLVEAKAPDARTTKIKASVEGRYFAYCTVFVNYIHVESVEITNTKTNIPSYGDFVSIKKGTQLTISITPSNATNKKVSWQSFNKLVEVDNNGFITKCQFGTFTDIKVTTEDGGKSFTVRVGANE